MRVNIAEKFQGNPCQRGHSGLRYRGRGACVECTQLNAVARRERLKQAAAERANAAEDSRP